jgi:hypothetical protein
MSESEMSDGNSENVIRNHKLFPFICYFKGCGRRFKQEAGAAQHMITGCKFHPHNDENKKKRKSVSETFACDSEGCGRKFTSESGLQDHKSACKFNTGKAVASVDQLLRETGKKQKTQKGTFACHHSGCIRVFGAEQSMRDHMMDCKFGVAANMDVSTSPKGQSRNRGKKQDTETVRVVEFACTHSGCSRKFRSEEGLKDHMKDCKFNIANDAATVQSGTAAARVVPFACTHSGCTRHFKSQESLGDHMKSCKLSKGDPDANAQKGNIKTAEADANTVYFACTHSGCTRKLRSDEGLTDHMNNCKFRPSSFSCTHEGCSRILRSEEGLRDHMKDCKFGR